MSFFWLTFFIFYCIFFYIGFQKKEKQMNTYKIGNVEIKSSTRGSTGYAGSTFSPAFTGNPRKPFIAAVGNPTDPSLVKLLSAKQRTSLHLGHYADSREAAYVVGAYRKDPHVVLQELAKNGKLEIEFPDKLYTLPEKIQSQEATDIVNDARKMRKLTSKIKTAKIVKYKKPGPLAIKTENNKETCVVTLKCGSTTVTKEITDFSQKDVMRYVEKILSLS
jgi:hypothetical protein